MSKTSENPADYIVPLNMNGLQGRMMHLPPPRSHKREILVVYGSHALLERWWGLVQNFSKFGAVTMPDLPGFGGMDSFYKIGQKPTLDAFADYLAAFIKMQYKRRRVTIVGISFGFVVATRMLQRYPELAKRVDFLISAVGFMHRDDFTFSKRRMFWSRAGLRLVALPGVSTFFRYVCLNGFVLRRAYSKTSNAKHKFDEVAGEADKFQEMMNLEIRLWHENDVRTWASTTAEFLNIDNCQKQVKIPVWHVCSKNDHYFDNNIVEQHMRVVFTDCRVETINIKTHAPSILSDRKASAILIPPALRRVLMKS